FRRAPDGGGDALELEAACASLLDAAAESLPKEGESAVAVLRRMSALKAAVDLTTVGLPMTRAIQRDFVAAIRRHLTRFGRQSVWAHVECRKNASIQLERLLRGGFLNDQSTALDDARYCV
ncbi:26S proteasome non-ATPase regulatory subunit 7, partial [Perkinsus olseni]